MSNGSSKQTQGEVYALNVQNTLRKHGPLTFVTLVARTALAEQKVRIGLRLSRRTIKSPHFTNEIVASASIPGSSPVYYLCTTPSEADTYEKRRRIIALGHIASVIALEEKAQAKWPNPQRAAAIQMMAMAQTLLTTAP